MRLSSFCVALCAAFFVGNSEAFSESASVSGDAPLVLAKLNTFSFASSPWDLPEGRTKDVQIPMGKAVLTMPYADVEKDGEKAVTITTPEIMITKEADWDANGGLRALDVLMRFQRRDDTMAVTGSAKDIIISDGDAREARGQFSGFDFTLTASGYEPAMEALKAGEKSGSEPMQKSMRTLDLAVSYSVESTTFKIESPDRGPAGRPGKVVITSGPSEANLILGGGRIGLDARGTENAFSVDAAMPVSGTIGLLAYGFSMPTDPTPDPQPMQFNVEIGDAEIGESVWNMVDPTKAFPRELDHVKAEVEMNVLLKESMFDSVSRNARKAKGERALDPVDVKLTALEFDGLGLDVSGSADLAMAGDKPTDIAAFLSVSGLTEFMKRVVKAGMMQQAQAIMAEGVALQFGKENDDGSLSFDVETQDGMIVINDKPVAPLPK